MSAADSGGASGWDTRVVCGFSTGHRRGDAPPGDPAAIAAAGEHSLFMDDHIIAVLVLIGLAVVGAGKTGSGSGGPRTEVVQRYSGFA